MEWQWSKFSELSLDDLYIILAERQNVFVVEQNCPYSDADGQDQQAFHLSGWSNQSGERALSAYLRILPPNEHRKEVAIGRVLTAADFRGQGLGKLLMAEAVKRAKETFPEKDLYLSAQAHLQDFYGEFGFSPEGDVYDEDGIPHIAMYSRRSTDGL